MFDMCPSGQQCDLHIGDRRTDQDAFMLPLFQMRQNQPLPVAVQHILTAIRSKNKTASCLSRLQKEMDFRIMTQRFKMSYPFYRFKNRLFVDDISLIKGHRHTEALFDQTF